MLMELIGSIKAEYKLKYLAIGALAVTTAALVDIFRGEEILRADVIIDGDLLIEEEE